MFSCATLPRVFLVSALLDYGQCDLVIANIVGNANIALHSNIKAQTNFGLFDAIFKTAFKIKIHGLVIQKEHLARRNQVGRSSSGANFVRGLSRGNSGSKALLAVVQTTG